MLLDVTVKNTTDETLDVEELMYSMKVTDDLDYTGFQDHLDVYDTVEVFVRYTELWLYYIGSTK
ncbi:hypothetical protein [Pseudogracilibacillus sp. SO10305]|uniref:hypothetical protein n=1 Tax=Pseudogracilibacillus sp. SO10305 TaxID=3098292 RepID=UPI00300DD084